MKKLSAFALALIMVLSVVSMASCANLQKGDLNEIADYVIATYNVTTEYGIFTYEDAPGDTANITQFQGSATIEKIVVPDVLNERTVNGIGKNAFYYCTSVKEIVIPSTVTFIGEFAFAGCEKLESIVLPANVEYIDKFAFEGCTSLKSVTLLRESAIDENGKETGVMITNLKSIGNYAFYGCTALTDFCVKDVNTSGINLPDTLEEVGKGAFLDCKAIETLVISNNIKVIGDMAFLGCTKITSITFPTSKVLTKEGLGEYIFSRDIKPVLEGPAAGTIFEEYVANIAYIAGEEEATTYLDT